MGSRTSAASDRMERVRDGLIGARLAIGRVLLRLVGRLRPGHYLRLDYPPASEDRPRYGYGRPAHQRLLELLRGHDGEYGDTLRMVVEHREELCRIERRSEDAMEPEWLNEWLPGLDSAAIYAFVRTRRPSLYMEVGSGTSTRFAARAIRDGGLGTRIVSIDPHPRAEVDELCDETIRTPLEDADLERFGELARGDVLFVDGSHRAFMNSDATTFFLDVLPALHPGILVGIHDVYLPYDYPPEFSSRYYSEQYLLAAYLLGGSGVRPVLPCQYVLHTPELNGILDPLWESPRLQGIQTHGGAFWLET